MPERWEGSNLPVGLYLITCGRTWRRDTRALLACVAWLPPGRSQAPVPWLRCHASRTKGMNGRCSISRTYLRARSFVTQSVELWDPLALLGCHLAISKDRAGLLFLAGRQYVRWRTCCTQSLPLRCTARFCSFSCTLKVGCGRSPFLSRASHFFARTCSNSSSLFMDIFIQRHFWISSFCV